MSLNATAALNGLIRDPIGQSLQASNSHDSRGFQDVDKENPASKFDAKILDVWTRGSGYICVHNASRASATIHPDVFEPIYNKPRDGENLIARFLVTRPVLNPAGRTSREAILGAEQRQLDYLPFTPQSMLRLFTEFELPPKWFWYRLHAYSVGNFYHHTKWDRTGGVSEPSSIAFVIHFPFILRPARHFDEMEPFAASAKSPPGSRDGYLSSRDDPYIWSVALNFSLKHGTTRGLLDGFTDSAFNDLYNRMLREGSHWIRHPLNIPIILLQIHIDHAAWDMDDVANHLSVFEQDVLDEDKNALKAFNQITTRLAHLGRALKFQSELTKSLMDTLSYVEEQVTQDQRRPYAQGFREISLQMKEKLTNFAFLAENYLESCRFMQIKTKDALDYMNAKVNAQDNFENIRSRQFQDRGLQAQLDDAESNRTISIIQLVFLPPIAVSAISSLSAFQWSKPGGGQYQAPFWLFWIIALCITLVVIVIYLLFKSRNHERNEVARRANAKLYENHDDWGRGRRPSDEHESTVSSRRTKRKKPRASSRHEMNRVGRPVTRNRLGESYFV